jgi:organic hydroperoxide reductase OsmC/OhrA
LYASRNSLDDTSSASARSLLDREIAQVLIDAAREIRPYSKAVHGNIAVETKLV